MEIYSKVLANFPDKQLRLTISEFRDVEYLHIREYYLDFDEEWKPTSRGISFPVDIETTLELFRGISEVISLAENRAVIEEYFADTIQEIYQK